MTITRFNPGVDLLNIQREVNRLFGDIFPSRKSEGDDLESAVWRPRVDVHEDDNSYIIDAELPGTRKEDVKINFHDEALTISGERKYEWEETNADKPADGNQKPSTSCHRMERVYGKFYRSFTFPTAVNPDNITATFSEGVLRVTIAKAEQLKPRQIEIV